MREKNLKHRCARAVFTTILAASLALSSTGFTVLAEEADGTENSTQAPVQEETQTPTPDADTSSTDDAEIPENLPSNDIEGQEEQPSSDEVQNQEEQPAAAQRNAAPAAVSAQNEQHELRLVYGDPALADEDAFILLIMGDGFKADEQEKFFTESKNTSEYVMATSPYDEFQDTVKIYALSVVSNESGAKGDSALTYEEAQADKRDTYFSSSYYTSGMQRLLSIGNEGREKANTLKNKYLPAADFNVIIVNATTYGGSGGSVCVASLNNESLEMMLHELGHTIAGLSDEYYAGDSYAGEFDNMTAESDPAKVKWAKYIGKNGVGVYEYDNGGDGWYRPHENCKMRFLGKRYEFCEVCKDSLRRAFCKNSNVTHMQFQTYAEVLRESEDPLDMKQYFILRKGSAETIGSDPDVANDLTLTFYDADGNNSTSDTPTKRGSYQVKASFAGNNTYDSCELTTSYTLDYPDIISLQADSKVYDGKPVDIKCTVDYAKEYLTKIHYTGQIPYSTTPEQTNTYDSDTAPITPGTYTAAVTAYDKSSNEIIGQASVEYTIKFKTTALADNNTGSYLGAQSYYNNQNIVFVGEGFTAAEQDKFEAIAKKYYDYFRNTEPYKEANLYFNYHTVEVISNDSGISKPGATKDTYFRLSVNANGKIQPTDLSTGAAMYLGNNQITSYYKGAIVIVNDDSVKGGARVDNKRVTLYAGPNEEGMKYAATEFMNYYAGSPEGTDWMKDDASKDAARTQMLKKVYYFWSGYSYAPVMSRAYNETFIENGSPIDLAPYFHTYINGIEVKDVSYNMTYFENKDGNLGEELTGAPSKAGSYFAKADLVPDEGKKTKKVTLDGQTHTLPIARGITPYTIQTKAVDKTALNNEITNAKTKLADESKYTQDTADALKKALAAAEKVSAQDDATQEEVDNALSNLKKAIQGLKEKTPDKATSTITSNGDKNVPHITVEGIFSDNAALNVKKIPASDDTYKKLKAKVASGMKILGAYDLTISGEAKGPFTITFDVGKDYNGRKAIVYHMLDNGEIESKETVVKDGKVVITVDSLSPFMVTVSEKSGTAKTAAKTGDHAPVIPMLLVCILAGGAVVFTVKKKKWS